jgi:hypothetical protein
MKLSEINLKKGPHNPGTDLCIMEAVAYFRGEPHSDHPVCACPVITKFAMRINDSCTEEQRQRLKPLIPLIAGTRDGNERIRAEIFAWAAIRFFAPYYLRRAGFNDHAENLANFEGTLNNASHAARVAANAAYAAVNAAAAYAAYAARVAANAAYAAVNAAAVYIAAYAAVNAAIAAYADADNGIEMSDEIFSAAISALEDALKIGRPDFSYILEEIEKAKKDLPDEEFVEEAIKEAKHKYIYLEKKND